MTVLPKLPEAIYLPSPDQAVTTLAEGISIRYGSSSQSIVDHTLTPPLPDTAILSPFGRQAKSKTEELAKGRVVITVWLSASQICT